MLSNTDRAILRDLARRVADIAALPIQAERREHWKHHNSLQSTRPMILVFPEGAWEELLTERDLHCEAEDARRIERNLRMRIYYHEHLRDDTVIESEWVVNKVVRSSGWGLEARHIPSPERRGAWLFSPVILEPADMAKLWVPEMRYDDPATTEALIRAQDLFGDILEVRLKGVSHISYHLMSQYTSWRGLEQVMLDMVVNPGWLHEAMAFLTEAHQSILQQYLDQNLLSLNNDSTYQSSGGNGYTDELPTPGYQPERVLPRDMWTSAESQELSGVSPAMHREFALQYEARLMEPFALSGYGCCEDLTKKLDDVLAVPNMRRISISPWADVPTCAAKLRGDYILSWKPKPAHMVGVFDEDYIRDYLREAVDVALQHGCVMEIVLKDTHTCQHHPERFDRWVQIAQEVREEALA